MPRVKANKVITVAGGDGGWDVRLDYLKHLHYFLKACGRREDGVDY